MKTRLLVFILAIFFAHYEVCLTQETDKSLDDFLDMSLEELMNLEVTSVSKKSERIRDVPSSIYVITSEDIQRSSARNLMQLLRDNVPGFWAVENDYKNVDAFIRNTFEESVLVLLDGTPMQDLLFASFDHENFVIPFDQIDRIEVIKGSGGTVYGANSATGVISIYTKNPNDNNKFLASANYALPGLTEASIIGSPLKSETISLSFYGKYGFFSGFDQIPETVNSTSSVPKLDGTGDTTIINRFTADDNKTQTLAGGLNLEYQVTNKLKLSSAIHLNTFNKKKYVQYFSTEKSVFLYDGTDDPVPFAEDTIVDKDQRKSRLVANLRADYEFSDAHALFARISTNYENSDMNVGGGYNASNGIIDVELQDNLTIGINNFAIGANYRSVNYNITDISSQNQILFIDAKNQESLIGLFIQDKISFLDGKFNLYLGVKGENFSLIDDKFYFSPMAKISYIPTDILTLWGGYSQSYTTPGYNQTNVEFTFFRAESPKVFYDYAYPQVTYSVYQTAYQNAINGGADEATAAAMAQAYIESDEGLEVIDEETNSAIAVEAALFPGHFNVAGVSSPNTVPSSFQNYEFGLRYHGIQNLAVETNFFYSVMKNGIGNSPAAVAFIPSKLRDGETLHTYYYGNYVKGINMGLESVLKFMATEKLMLELSHSWYSYTLEYQENDDFDINSLTQSEKELKDDKYPQLPEHVLRGKIYYDLLSDLKFTLSGTYATAHFVKFGTVIPFYQYQNQRFDPLYNDIGIKTIVGGKHDHRFVLNFRVDKYFFDQKLDIYLFGSDILSSVFAEGINQFETIYPRQVGGMIGIGATYAF